MFLFKTFKLVFCLAFIISIFSCKKKGSCPANGGSDIILSLLDQSAQPPSNVTVFFKADRKNGKPIAGLVETDFTIYEKGRNDECEFPISAFESNAQILQDPQAFAYCTVLVLDLSGSVTETALDELKISAKSFVDQVLPTGTYDTYKMGIWWFDGSPQIKNLAAVSNDPIALKSAIDGIDETMSQDNSTNLYGAIVQSTQLASQGIQAFQNQNILAAASVVIFTDGRDQAAIVSKQDALNAVNSADENIAFFTIGLGGEIDENILSQIGADGTAFASDSGQLQATFTEIASLVFEEANSYYLFEYCSPKRDGSGINQLKIRVQSGQEAGFLETSFDASGFTGGCD